MGVPNSEKFSIDKLKKGLFSGVGQLGNVRHPRRLIKIYREIFYRELSVPLDKAKTTATSGPRTVYMATKEDVMAVGDEEERKKRFQDKWIHFAFLKGDDQQWYVYDPASDNLKGKKDTDQIDKFGMYGFAKVDQKLIDENEGIKESAGDKDRQSFGYRVDVIDTDLLSCTFGYNYDQAAMQINIMLSNYKGKNRGVYHSGDVVKVYMWYDKPDKPDFTDKVEKWGKNTNIENEDTYLFSVRQKHYDKGVTEDGKSSYKPTPATGIYNNGVVLMFSGKIDDVSYDYSKQGGSKISLKGRSFGSKLTDVRIYRSYPNGGRLTMSHEEVIYDIISSQVGLPLGHLILGRTDWAIGSIPPEGKRKPGTILKFKELKNTKGAEDLDDINRRELEAGANNQYETEVQQGAKAQTPLETEPGKKNWIEEIGIEGLVQLNDDFAQEVMRVDSIKSDKPENKGAPFDPKGIRSITEAELESGANATPLWIYKDGKTGKNYNANFGNNVALRTILINLNKLKRKFPVELMPEHWSEYGIRVPQPVKREDGKPVNATRVFFIDGWNAVKYIMQQRAITTSAERATKIHALLALNDPTLKWGDAGLATEGKDNAIWPTKEVKGFGEDKIILYKVTSKGKFNVINFAKELHVITEDEIDRDAIEKFAKNKQKNGSFMVVEEAIKRDKPDALLRIKLFYKTVRQFTRARHDIGAGKKPRSVYANTDALLQPVDEGHDNYAIEFPTVKRGQIIVLPKHIVNAPRKWIVGANAVQNEGNNNRYEIDLTTNIKGIYEGEGYKTFGSVQGSAAFDEIVPPDRRAADELDPLNMSSFNPSSTLSPLGDWKLVFPDGTVPAIDPTKGTKVSFQIIEDSKLLRQLKKQPNDLIFDGDTIFEAVKKIVNQYFDIIQYVDEFGFYNVRPRYASKIDQRFVYTLEAGKNRFPKLISSKAEENSSQTINRVVLMGKSPNFSEVVIVIVNDDESIRRHGVKQDFVQMNKIDNVIDAIKTAKKRLLGFRQRIRKAQIVCEPILELRPGHRINVYDIDSSLAGPYLVTNVGINYSKSGGAVQTFNAYSVGDFYNTDDLSGKAFYYSKGAGDQLKYRKQWDEKQLKSKQEAAAKVVS
jgi:hypothetical protein